MEFTLKGRVIWSLVIGTIFLWQALNQADVIGGLISYILEKLWCYIERGVKYKDFLSSFGLLM